MKRNVDERSLDCLNCKVLGLRADGLVWNYDPKGPYEVDQLLKEQARKREEALNAELEMMQKEALEKGRRDMEARKLAPFEGDWVLQRATKYEPLTIMGVWRTKQIRGKRLPNTSCSMFSVCLGVENLPRRYPVPHGWSQGV